MQNRWNEMSYNRFPSFRSRCQRSVYEQWCEYIDDIEDVVEESEEREDSAWFREANSCIFVRYGLLL
jgi:hypothetical protein